MVGVAQLVEHLIVVQDVAGSSPVTHPTRLFGWLRQPKDAVSRGLLASSQKRRAKETGKNKMKAEHCFLPYQQLSLKTDDSTYMHYVYILQSQSTPKTYYTGKTNNLKRRFSQHNNAQCKTTSKNIPWTVKNYFAFLSETKASEFEKYLKSSRGRRFAKRHF